MRVVPRGFWRALVLGVLAASLTVGQASAQQPGTAFASPEDAVREYLAGVAAADVDRILATVAADEMAAGFQFEAYIDRLKAFLPFLAPAPATDPLFIEMDRISLTDQVMDQARMLIYSLLTDVDLEGSPTVNVDAAWAASFAAQLDLDRLAALTTEDVQFPEPELATSERMLANAASMAAIYGADELTERLALIELDGRRYLIAFTLLRYGDSWKVSSQSSALSGLPSTGVAQPFPRD
jgi:hypothetical protein